MDDRLRSEQAFHNEQAAERRRGWENDPARLRFAPEEYLDHEPWVLPALARLGDVAGKRVLDFGCGHGMAACCLAQRGAEVIAFDLSAGYVHEAVERARAHGLVIHGLMADGARLPIANHSIDAIWGVAILHHLAIEQAAREIHRILRPGGVAVFCEPWGGNPLLRWARRWLPYVGKERTEDEAPLMSGDIEAMQAVFPAIEVEYVQLFGMIRRAWRSCPFLGVMDRMDNALLRNWKAVRLWCRYVVVTMRNN